jgi:ABC-2 type transport system permease protein
LPACWWRHSASSSPETYGTWCSSATLIYLATPDRTRVLLAKVPAAALTGAVFGLVAAAISTGLGLAFIAGRGDAIVLGISGMLGHAAGAMVGAALLAMIGVGLGSLIRSQLAESSQSSSGPS